MQAWFFRKNRLPQRPQGMSAVAARKQALLSSWRQLLRLIARLPEQKRAVALAEARNTVKQRKAESNPETLLAYQKELAAKIGYLRIVTPRQPGDVDTGIGRWVMRDGELVEGEGLEKGERVGSPVLSWDEAMKLNNKHFKKFYGADKPPAGKIFF